jgi:hypothetical protein
MQDYWLLQINFFSEVTVNNFFLTDIGIFVAFNILLGHARKVLPKE